MIRVEVPGKIGYGDICGPIAYAHNLSFHTRQHVELVFHWPYSRDHKTYPQDPETLAYRADYIYGLMLDVDTSIRHVFETPINFDGSIPYINYQFRYDAHNHWWSKKNHQQTNDKIIICSPTKNLEPFTPKKLWKDVIPDKWEFLIDQFDADVVSYRTPIADLVNKLLGCRLFIGYHGSCAWVARHLRVPMVIFSGDNYSSNKMFPATVHQDIRILGNIDKLVFDGQYKIRKFDKTLSRFKFTPRILGNITTC